MIAIQASGGSQLEATRPTPRMVSDGCGCLVLVALRPADAADRAGAPPRSSW